VRTENATYASPQINRFKESDDEDEGFHDLDIEQHKLESNSNDLAVDHPTLEDWTDFDNDTN